MSDPFVADASVGLGWVHPSQASEISRRLMQEAEAGSPIVVPSIWHLELANALLVAVRRKLMTDSQRRTALNLLGQLRVIVDEETSTRAFSVTSEVASTYGLSVYDAAYLELARRRGLGLGSRDEPLRAAAKKCGVRLL